MNEPKFTIYRLRIESFMAGVPASESDSKMIAGFILKHLMDITFLDGNGEKTTTYGAAVLDDFAYVTIEKKKNMTRDKKDCRDKEIVPTYPDFSLVLDARDPQKEGILIGIQHQRKCFANLETVRKGLENYWDELVGKNGGYRVDLRQITSSNKFWHTLEKKIKQGSKLTGLHLDLDKVLADTGIDEQTGEKAVLFTSFLKMLNDIGAGNGGFFFNALPGTGLNLERAEYNLGMVVALACQRGFVVKAQVDNNPDWITSESSAPFTMRLSSSAFIKPEGTVEQVRDENKRQLHALKMWFDNIITELNQINNDKQNEQTRHTVKR